MRKQVWLVGGILAVAALFPALAISADEDTLTLPAGSTLQVRLMTTLSTRTNRDGDPFSGRVVEPIIYEGEEVVPAGSVLEGRVAYVKDAGRVKGVGEMRLVAETITTPGDVKFSLVAGLQDAQGAEGARVKDEEGTIKGSGKSTKGGAIESGVGAGTGAAVGAIGAGGSGALYGAGIGAAAGLIHTLLKKHKGVILPQGTELTFVIERTTTAKRVPRPPKAE
ncbi:MAG: hypothetical protein ABSA70_17145 [Terriglobia bacterium]